MPSIWKELALASRNSQRSAEPPKLDVAHTLPNLLTCKLEDLDYLVQHGPPFSLKDLPAYVDAIEHMGVGLDDRKMLLEKIVVLMSRLPPDSDFSWRLQRFVIGMLYKDIPHHPASYLALPPVEGSIHAVQGVRYAYRSANGSDYNPRFPSLGRAGTPYAQSVPSATITSTFRLPEPSLVFDTLLQRDEFIPHPGGLSSLFFAFANLIVHTIFNTNHSDWSINNASSYLDLSVLYGRSEQQVNAVRRNDGTGKLWEDVFADSRLLFMPPSVGALLVMFSRNHNYIAEKISKINENGTFKTPPNSPVDRATQDEEIFQRARLVNCGFFVQAILRDYVGAILGLIRDGTTWRLDPLQNSREIDHDTIPRGEGNAVSVEFNLLYRWHAAISSQDAEWTENLFSKLFKGKDFNSITVEDFREAAQHMTPDPDVKKWTFGGLTRKSDGSFDDTDLASIIQNATGSAASAFKARGIPTVFRVVEIMGMEQARSWGTCSLNEFRKFIGLKPYTSFAEWNPNLVTHTAAASLYHHIDNLELHVGLQAEETKVPQPGAALCPGYTISRAILSDAVCLTRGDRFLTNDFTPNNLTSWGYNDCKADEDDGSLGGMISKLLLRHLGEYYPTGSIYAHFPFIVPEKMKDYMANLPDFSVDDYVWEKPEVVKRNRSSFETRIMTITKVPIADMRSSLFSEEAIEKWSVSYQEIAKQLLQDKLEVHSERPYNYTDVIRDLINLVPVYWIANYIVGISLKSDDNPSGMYRGQELYTMFAQVADYVFINADISRDWALCKKSQDVFDVVCQAILPRLHGLSSGFMSTSRDLLRLSHGTDSSASFIEKLRHLDSPSVIAIAGGLFAETVATAALYSRALTDVANILIRDEAACGVTDSGFAPADGDTQILVRIKSVLRTYQLQSEICNGLSSNLGSILNRSEAIDGYVSYGMMNQQFFEKTAIPILREILNLPGINRASPNQSEGFTFQAAPGVVQE